MGKELIDGAGQDTAVRLNARGIMYRDDEHNYDKAAECFRKAAEQGNDESQNSLGELYITGRGVPRDPVQAMMWFRKAADQKNADAQFNLGLMYFEGDGTGQNYSLALDLYLKAAERGKA